MRVPRSAALARLWRPFFRFAPGVATACFLTGPPFGDLSLFPSFPFFAFFPLLCLLLFSRFRITFPHEDRRRVAGDMPDQTLPLRRFDHRRMQLLHQLSRRKLRECAGEL